MGRLLGSPHCCLQRCRGACPFGSWPFGILAVRGGLIAWLLEVLLAALSRTAVWLLAPFSRTAHPIDFIFDAACTWVLSSTVWRWLDEWFLRYAKDSHTHIHTYRQTEIPSFIVRWCCYSATHWPNGTKFAMVTQTSYLHISTKCGCNSTKRSGDMTFFVM